MLKFFAEYWIWLCLGILFILWFWRKWSKSPRLTAKVALGLARTHPLNVSNLTGSSTGTYRYILINQSVCLEYLITSKGDVTTEKLVVYSGEYSNKLTIEYHQGAPPVAEGSHVSVLDDVNLLVFTRNQLAKLPLRKFTS